MKCPKHPDATVIRVRLNVGTVLACETCGARVSEVELEPELQELVEEISGMVEAEQETIDVETSDIVEVESCQGRTSGSSQSKKSKPR